MPRNLPTGLISLLKSGYAETHSFLVINLLGPGRTIGKTIYLATCTETQGGGGNPPRPATTYLPHLRQTGPVKMSLARSADRCDVIIENIDLFAGLDFVAKQDALYGSFAQFGRIWRDLRNPANTFWVTLLTGQVIGARASEQEVQLALMSDIYSSGAIAGQMVYSLSCPWTFKDSATCAYVGPETVCNKLLNDPGGCSGRSNQFHYGGFPYIDSQASIGGAAALQSPTFNQTILTGGSLELEGAEPRTTSSLLQRHNLLLQGFTVTDDAANDATKIVAPGGSALVGTPGHIPKYSLVDGALGDTSGLREDANQLYEVNHDFILDATKSIYLGGAANAQGQALHWDNSFTPPRLLMGPSTGTGEIIDFRTGTNAGSLGRMVWDGVNGRLSLNSSEATNATDGPGSLFIKPKADDSAIWIEAPAATGGYLFVGFIGTTARFVVDNLGQPIVINGVSYPTWPNAQGAANTFLRNDGSGHLSWAAASGGSGGSVGPGTNNRLARFTASDTIGDAGIDDNGSEILILGVFNRKTLRSDTANDL